MPLVHPKYKVAVVQAAPVWLDLDAGIDKTIALVNEAAGNGAKLISFPETWLPGYPWHIWMGAHAWQVRRGFIQRYFDNSLDYDSPEASRLSAAVRQAGITAVIGVSKRCGGSLYMGQWIIGADGRTIAARRKLRPTHVERAVFGEGDGSDLAVHQVEGLGRIGALCCWEHLQPLSKYAMYAQNEQVHVAAWPSFSNYEPFAPALGWEVNNAASRIYAVEGSCYVLAPCAVVSKAMIDELCDTPEKRDLNHVGGGHAVIYGPDGSTLIPKLPEDREGILYADIDLATIVMAKNAADPAGHYSRPDVTRLLINQSRMRRVDAFALPVDRSRNVQAAYRERGRHIDVPSSRKRQRPAATDDNENRAPSDSQMCVKPDIQMSERVAYRTAVRGRLYAFVASPNAGRRRTHLIDLLPSFRLLRRRE